MRGNLRIGDFRNHAIEVNSLSGRFSSPDGEAEELADHFSFVFELVA